MPTIEEILRTAKEAGASDVHLTVGVPPKMRVNGELITMDFPKLMPSDTLAHLDSVTLDAAPQGDAANAKPAISERRRRYEENGECDFSFSIASLGRFRVNAFKQRNSAALAFRLVGTQVPKPEELGLPESVVNLYERKHGLVLVTGPTGSGKSTTLAAIVDKINNNRDAHVITLEDPIEFLHSHNKSIVNQREIGLDSRSYANALRAALREDPDVILVGEMRDFETISIAITAAETGHLVLSTLHTIGAASTVDRVIDVFPPHQQQQIRVQLSSVLEAVISQQLIPTADGTGRVAAFEVLHANPAIRNLIREGKTHQIPSVMQTNRKVGMITMDEAILNLYTEGKISKEDAVEFAQDPDNMDLKLRQGTKVDALNTNDMQKERQKRNGFNFKKEKNI